MEGRGETRACLLRCVGRPQRGKDSDEALQLARVLVGSASGGKQVGLPLVLLGGRYAETGRNQEAQDHVVACALCARLFGQLGPSRRRRHGRPQNLDEPPQRLALAPLQGPPMLLTEDTAL